MIRLFPVLLFVSALLTGTAGAGEMPRVRLVTSMGDIVLALDDDKAPKTVENFLGYVNNGFYDGTIFHRVIDGFMIQGGGFNRDFDKKMTQPSIPNEADNGLKNDRGSVAMARTRDPNSATSQFFINVKDNPNLTHTAKSPRGWGYAVFGQVAEGMDVVDRIRVVPTTTHGYYRNVPVEPVIIESAVVEPAKSME
jgi:peptidyl-prolyl cis-trans isomerase B (cyclophilin B)